MNAFLSQSYKYEAAEFHLFIYSFCFSYSVVCSSWIFTNVFSLFWCSALQGRNPFFLEPAIIIAISDGNKLTSSGGVQDEVSSNATFFILFFFNFSAGLKSLRSLFSTGLFYSSFFNLKDLKHVFYFEIHYGDTFTKTEIKDEFELFAFKKRSTSFWRPFNVDIRVERARRVPVKTDGRVYIRVNSAPPHQLPNVRLCNRTNQAKQCLVVQPTLIAAFQAGLLLQTLVCQTFIRTQNQHGYGRERMRGRCKWDVTRAFLFKLECFKKIFFCHCLIIVLLSFYMALGDFCTLALHWFDAKRIENLPCWRRPHKLVNWEKNRNLITCYSLFLIQLHLPLTTPLPGSELTKEPFRWDQRLFALVLRIPGNASVEPEPLGGVPSDDSPITPMCEVTGGRKKKDLCVEKCFSRCTGCFFFFLTISASATLLFKDFSTNLDLQISAFFFLAFIPLLAHPLRDWWSPLGIMTNSSKSNQRFWLSVGRL